ncbi:hypothetical protein VPH35_051332 [Triticum aestivum]
MLALAQPDKNQETHFHTTVNHITQSMKTQKIKRPLDEVAICFFNTKEKRNLQDLAGVYVYNATERDSLDRPNEGLITEFSCIEDSFMNNIGSQYGMTSGSKENALYNALWVAQALLCKGSLRTLSKRILIFTNQDDPFIGITGAAKTDMIRRTIQYGKDARALGLSIELPLSKSDENFNMSLFYADLIGLDEDEIVPYMPSSGEKMAADNKMHFLKLEEEVVIPTTFKCAITYDLLFKPVVLVCGHTFSFWSIAEHMSILVDTLCPLCKTQFAHFPKICETYHTLVKKLKPAEYARVEAEFLEQERSLGRSSPPVDVGLQDELCFECNKLLYKPSVLNCGHVCCKSCLPSSDGLLACKRCGVFIQGSFPLCAFLWMRSSKSSSRGSTLQGLRLLD